MVISMTSSFLSIKNKLALVSIALLAPLFVSSATEAKIAEMAEYHLMKDDFSSAKEILLFSIHKDDKTYYVLMTPSLEDMENEKKTSETILKKNKNIEDTIPLEISRKEFNKKFKNLRPSGYNGDFLQE